MNACLAPFRGLVRIIRATGVGSLRHRIRSAWYSWCFRNHCARAGRNISVGPIYFDGTGFIEAGDDLVIRSRSFNLVEISVAPKARLHIGNNVGINQGTRIACSQEISIGDGCMIGDECVIIDNDFHGINKGPAKCDPIRIGNNVWLATRVIVLRGVTIGEGSIICAGSVVTHSIGPHCLAAGIPARTIQILKDPAPSPPVTRDLQPI
jgi:acetyltransferase-like isoleucine patch superfamily enzyme